MCTANSVSPKSHNGVCHPRGNSFVDHCALCPLKYKGFFFSMSLFLFGMIEIDMLKCCGFYKDWETTNCAP